MEQSPRVARSDSTEGSSPPESRNRDVTCKSPECGSASESASIPQSTGMNAPIVNEAVAGLDYQSDATAGQVDDPVTLRRIFPPRWACATASLMEERG